MPGYKVYIGPRPNGYSTLFNGTENPVSEGGRWSRNQSNSWTNMRMENGVCHGTNGITNQYDDSYALLSGFGPDYEISGSVYVDANIDTNVTHEVELLGRGSDNATQVSLIECLFNIFGGIDIVKWNGPYESFTSQTISNGSSLGRNLQTGDVIKARFVGLTAFSYINGALMGQATHDLATGLAGIGAFTRPGGNSAHLCLRDFTLTPL